MNPMSTDQEPTPSQKSELFNVPVLAGSDAGGLKALGLALQSSLVQIVTKSEINMSDVWYRFFSFYVFLSFTI